MANTMNQLNSAFGIEGQTYEVLTTSGEVIVPQQGDVAKNVDYDYEQTRTNLHSLLAQGREALNHALEVAKSSEHPRAFEVVGGLMKQLADINHQLLDLSEKRQKFDAKPTAAGSAPVTNNAIFVGSTMELSQMLRDIKKEQ